jgi:hypothetical protein
MTRLQVFVRQLHLKAYMPQRWGDSQVLTVKTGDDFDLSNMSSAELERRILDLDEKSATVKRVA